MQDQTWLEVRLRIDTGLRPLQFGVWLHDGGSISLGQEVTVGPFDTTSAVLEEALTIAAGELVRLGYWT